MRIKIKKEEVRLGMYLDAFEGKWLDHPFWRKKFLVEKPEDLQAVLDSPIKELWIDTDKGLSPLREEGPIVLSELPPESNIIDEPLVEKAVSTEQELNKAKKIIDLAKPMMKGMFDDVRLGKAIDVEQCLPIVDEVSDSVTRNASALTSLLRLKKQDEYTYMHSVAVSALMAALAIELKQSKVMVRLACLAGMFHDLGKSMMPLEVLNKPGKLTDAEFSIIRTHPREGYYALRRIGGMPEEVLDVCLHHHEKFDGSGYPNGLAKEDISLISRMAAVCDVYDAVTSERPYKSPWPAPDALSRMMSWKGHFDPDVLKSFIRCVGIYPLGSVVLLASGRLAVVVDQNPDQLVKPVVKIFFSTKSKVPLKTERLNLAQIIHGEPVDRIINRENPEKWGIPEERVFSLWVPA